MFHKFLTPERFFFSGQFSRVGKNINFYLISFFLLGEICECQKGEKITMKNSYYHEVSTVEEFKLYICSGCLKKFLTLLH